MSKPKFPAPASSHGKPEKPENGSEEDGVNPGFFSEFLEFLSHNRKWWLVPLIVLLLLVGGLLILAGQNIAIAPFIYTLF